MSFKQLFSQKNVRIIMLILIPILITGIVLTSLFILNNNNTDASSSNINEVINPEVEIEKNPINNIKGMRLVFETDYTVENIDSITENISKSGFNTLYVDISSNGKLLFSESEFASVSDSNILEKVFLSAKKNNLQVIALVNVTDIFGEDFFVPETLNKSKSVFLSKNLTKYCDAVVLDGYEISPENDNLETIYNASSYVTTIEDFTSGIVNNIVETYYNTLSSAAPQIPFGIFLSSKHTEYFSTDENNNLTFNCPTLNPKKIIEEIVDFAIIGCSNSTKDKNLTFDSVVDYWISNINEPSKLIFFLSNELNGTGGNGWNEYTQTLQQLIALKDKNQFNFILNSYAKFNENTYDSSKKITEFILNNDTDNITINDLVITYPENKNITVKESFYNIRGSSDPNFPVTVNGTEIERNDLGYFSIEYNLEPGKNTFVFKHKGNTQEYVINYQKVIIDKVSPAENITLNGGSTLVVTANALKGSTVTATFNGTTITLQLNDDSTNDTNTSEYSDYIGKFVMPDNLSKNKNLGAITFKAVSSFGTATKKSGKITVKKTIVVDDTSSENSGNNSSNNSSNSESSNTEYIKPVGPNYIDVGHTYIAEVVKYQAETFDADDLEDWSRPTNNYLPKGTVDYCSPNTLVVPNTKIELRTLRYGKQLYTTYKKIENTIMYQGTLPNTNKVSLNNYVEAGRHTILTFDVDWKAPFLFDLLSQKYKNEGDGGNRDYTISSATYSYIDITFCYASEFNAELDFSNNKIFSKAEIFKNQSDYTLRLHLRKTGKFYGWTAEYNSQGQLQFYFLNPATLTVADNEYGYRLDGIVILIDAGHGGGDPGALGFDSNYHEADLNLMLAQKLKSRLENLGATVVMTRDSDVSVENENRIKLVKQTRPDFVLSIHRNSSSRTQPHGFASYHFNAFSADAAKKIYNTTADKNLYKDPTYYGVKWHYFYLSRTTDCPIVLTENGFVSNKAEYTDLKSSEFNDKCADAFVDGIFEYFKSIQ